jgi:hypothetical protein
MAQITIDIPDQLIARAQAAAQRMNERLPKGQRIDMSDVQAMLRQELIGVLRNLIIADVQQSREEERDEAIRRVQQEITDTIRQ